MCDPISIGLTLAGTAMQAYGQQQVQSAQKRDINAAGASYEAERGRQQGFEGTNAKTVADTLDSYSRPQMDQRYADATAKREVAYTSPLQSKSFVADRPADYDANAAVTSRNAATGATRKSYALGEALSKAKLDAYGDANQKAGFRAADNSNQIGMTNRIATGSQRAEGIQQGTLQSKMAVDQHQGDTIGGIGDLFTTAGMLNGGGALKGMFGGPGSGVGGGMFGMGKPIGQSSGAAFNWS